MTSYYNPIDWTQERSNRPLNVFSPALGGGYTSEVSTCRFEFISVSSSLYIPAGGAAIRSNADVTHSLTTMYTALLIHVIGCFL